MLHNPNFGVEMRNLQDPDNAKLAFVETSWSEASNTIAVGDGQSVLADRIVRPEIPKLPAKPTAAEQAAQAAALAAEATAQVVVKVLNFEAAQETFALLTLRRGALVAGTANQFILNPLQRDVSRKAGANVRSDLVLADFHGGEKIEQDLEAPVEMLFINSAGQLVVQNSVQDEIWVKAVNMMQELFAKRDEQAAPKDDGMGDAQDPAKLLEKAGAGGAAGR
jgi:hypothetical protein